MKAAATEQDYLLAIHKMSMSDDPGAAVQGRLLKEIMPVVLKWVETERARFEEHRGFDDRVEFLSVTVGGMAAAMVSAALTGCTNLRPASSDVNAFYRSFDDCMRAALDDAVPKFAAFAGLCDAAGFETRKG